MTDQTTSDVENQLPSEQPPLAPPRQVRQGPTGKRPANASPLEVDGFSTEDSPTNTSSRTRTKRSVAPTAPSAGVPSSDVVESVKSDLKGTLLTLGGVVALPLPVTGITLVQRAELASESIVEIARNDPKLFARIQKFLAATKYSDLIYVGVCLATAVTVDLHIVPPNHPMAQTTIADVLEKFAVVPDVPQTEQNGTTPQVEYSSNLNRV